MEEMQNEKIGKKEFHQWIDQFLLRFNTLLKKIEKTNIRLCEHETLEHENENRIKKIESVLSDVLLVLETKEILNGFMKQKIDDILGR